MPDSIHAGDLLAGRYRLDDLLTESAGGRFWLAHDQVLHRSVAVHLIARTDERAEGLMAAARRTAPYHDRRLLRVLDADEADDLCYVVNEWGQGTSLDNMLAANEPLQPRRAAWVVCEIADSLARAHDAGLDHGRMVPENVLIDLNGQVRIIGFAVDAALHGLPPGRHSADLTDTAAVLYAALTGKWGGVSSSRLPAAPTEHGQVLRPRRVRAGIPRQLDDLCDQVINSTNSSRSAFDLSTMAGVAEALNEFVGDSTGMAGAESWLEHHAVTSAPAPWEVSEPSPAPEAAPEPSTEPDPDLHPEAAPPLTEMPTQAGIPVFDENNDVGWIQARSTTPSPPPPLEETQAKPLFAPAPPEGEPVRRARPGSTAAGQPREYWPWESTGTSTGIGAGPVSEPTDHGGDVVPGRNWFRLAIAVAIAVLIAVAALAAYQLGALNGELDGEQPADPTSPAEPKVTAPTPFTGLTAIDFDPQGSPPRDENSELVPLALDGDPASSWQTSTYKQNFGPTGLKDGVGLLVDLGSIMDVREIETATLGGPTSLSVYVTDTAPTGVVELTPAGTAAGNGVLTIPLDEAVQGRYVIVWLTSIPPLEGEFRGAIAEVEVRG